MKSLHLTTVHIDAASEVTGDNVIVKDGRRFVFSGPDANQITDVVFDESAFLGFTLRCGDAVEQYETRGYDIPKPHPIG